jgi:hypothetical protein
VPAPIMTSLLEKVQMPSPDDLEPMDRPDYPRQKEYGSTTSFHQESLQSTDSSVSDSPAYPLVPSHLDPVLRSARRSNLSRPMLNGAACASPDHDEIQAIAIVGNTE